jgi:hypothetical protein
MVEHKSEYIAPYDLIPKWCASLTYWLYLYKVDSGFVGGMLSGFEANQRLKARMKCMFDAEYGMPYWRRQDFDATYEMPCCRQVFQGREAQQEMQGKDTHKSSQACKPFQTAHTQVSRLESPEGSFRICI